MVLPVIITFIVIIPHNTVLVGIFPCRIIFPVNGKHLCRNSQPSDPCVFLPEDYAGF